MAETALPQQDQQINAISRVFGIRAEFLKEFELLTANGYYEIEHGYGFTRLTRDAQDLTEQPNANLDQILIFNNCRHPRT